MKPLKGFAVLFHGVNFNCSTWPSASHRITGPLDAPIHVAITHTPGVFGKGKINKMRFSHSLGAPMAARGTG